MRVVDLIVKKRDGLSLSTEEINFFVGLYTRGAIPDYQASALLMAIYFKGMSEKECVDLTLAMMNSGDVVDLSKIKGVKVDKHSTGGVGDTTTLVLAPLVASLDIPVAKMSGRGLGYTGGTNDKFESILGFKIELSKKDFIDQVNTQGVAVIGQSEKLTPADKKIYALRDVTGTVESIPLIASSIMSKKLAGGADAIVLDVKTGEGAFMKTVEESEKLAQAMVNIGNYIGRKTMAIISDMSQPLGFAIGNALEIKEAIDTLKGNGPADLTELTLTLGSQMVVLAGKANTLDEAKELLKEVIANGKAIKKLKTLISAQGGDSSIVDNPEKLVQAPFQIELPAKKSGYISRVTADKVGLIAMQLGAGRSTKDDIIDPSVGIVLHKKIGDKVSKGESLLTIHAKVSTIDKFKEQLYNCISIEDKAIVPKLIHKIIIK